MTKKPSKTAVVLLLLIVATAGLYYYIAHKPNKGAAPPRPTIERTGAGTIADYSEVSGRLHTTVHDALLATGLIIGDTKEGLREISRQGVEGLIRWHTWQIQLVVGDDMTPDKIQQLLNGTVTKAGGEIFGSQPDIYQGAPVIRMDIGFRDNLAGEPLTIVTDRLYISKNKKNLPTFRSDTAGTPMAIIIDDFGYQSEPIELFAAINHPFTFSVLPNQPFSKEAAARALSSGHQAMLHLPMEPLSIPEQVEKDMITVKMTDAEIQEITNRAIHTLPGVIGVNNHQGSRATADRRVMRAALMTIKANQLFFVDSHTSGQTIAVDVARGMGIQAAENDLFIDNSSDISAIKTQLRAAQRTALKYGSVTVIGHARSNTATALREMIPELEANGIRLVFVSQLVK
jgi:polysaccharide deacetylase 2 family uncharacterized protein YibQ